MTAVEFLVEFMSNDKQKSEGIISLANAKATTMHREHMIDFAMKFRLGASRVGDITRKEIEQEYYKTFNN